MMLNNCFGEYLLSLLLHCFMMCHRGLSLIDSKESKVQASMILLDLLAIGQTKYRAAPGHCHLFELSDAIFELHQGEEIW